MNGKVIAGKLHEMQNAISGANNHPEIREMLSAFGYTEERMREGIVLLEKVNSLMAKQVEIYGEQYAAGELVSQKWEKAYSDYMVTLKVIRVAFKDRVDALTAFKATGKRTKSLSGWLREARIMYTNLLLDADALLVMNKYGFTKERLLLEQQRVNEIEEIHGKRLEKKGDAQQSTVDRDKAYDELANWYSDFRAIARIALYEKPQLLEAMGIVKK